MKILLINTLYAAETVGGAERFVRTLAEGLAASGLEPVVAATTPKDAREELLGGVK
ncbi:MAG: glycosyltransferase, partial [Rubrobacter sp.]|nr:glycosyltransferase [Rubrobacter sp.]